GCCSLLIINGFIYSCFFFFSSRRRHTRFSRDWSSDVCSSDLGLSDLPPQLLSQGTALRSLLGQCAGAVAVAGLGAVVAAAAGARSEERRVGKECRARWWPYHQKEEGESTRWHGNWRESRRMRN